MLLILSRQATIETDLVSWVLGLFLTMFLLTICVGIVGTYVQRKRSREWMRIEKEKQGTDSNKSYR
jgi:hypothetical protein